MALHQKLSKWQALPSSYFNKRRHQWDSTKMNLNDVISRTDAVLSKCAPRWIGSKGLITAFQHV